MVAQSGARDETGVGVGRVALSQAFLFVLFFVLPAAAVLFLASGVEGAVRLRLAFAHVYVVAPLGLASAFVVAGMAASVARAASRPAPDAGLAGRIRAFPAWAALVAFLSGFFSYVLCGYTALGGAETYRAALWCIGAAASVIYGLVTYAAAERYLAPVFAYLTAKRVRFAPGRRFPLAARYIIGGGAGGAALVALAALGPASGGAGAWGWGQWLAAAVLVAVWAAAAYIISGHVTAPLRTAVATAPITFYVGDELEELTATCRRFFDEVRAFDEEVRLVAEDLSAEAARVRESLTEQASLTSEQASAISETSVTMKELTGTVKQTAERAEDISGRVESSGEFVRTARDQITANAERIEQLAEEAQATAKLALALNESARRMDQIVALVNDLAEQSTVLALNAAIEAAKAGEFGRGFAAVAREVKNLAASSKAGTEEIRKVLHSIRDGTVKTVGSARGSAEQSDVLRDGAAKTKSLVEEIVPLVDDIGRTSKQIAASARQQSLGLEQVTTAVENINEAAAEALDQVKAVRDTVDKMVSISARLVVAADASRQWKES